MQTDQMQLSILRAAQAVNTRIPACHVLRKSQQPLIVYFLGFVKMFYMC